MQNNNKGPKCKPSSGLGIAEIPLRVTEPGLPIRDHTRYREPAYTGLHAAKIVLVRVDVSHYPQETGSYQ